MVIFFTLYLAFGKTFVLVLFLVDSYNMYYHVMQNLPCLWSCMTVRYFRQELFLMHKFQYFIIAMKERYLAVCHLSLSTRGYDMIQLMHSSKRQPISLGM